jgi:hypothetical protein
MTAEQLRKIALSFEGASEGAHGGHADFRVGGKVFASLGAPVAGAQAPGDDWGMAKLTPEEQRSFLAADAEAFVPCAGAWGKRGYTNIRLAVADRKMVRAALEAAYASMT